MIRRPVARHAPERQSKTVQKNARSASSIDNRAAMASSKGSLKRISADVEIQSVNMTWLEPVDMN